MYTLFSVIPLLFRHSLQFMIKQFKNMKKEKENNFQEFSWRPAQPALCFSPSMSWDRPQPTVTLHRMSGYRECVYGWMNFSSLSVNSAFIQLPYPENISKRCTKSLINPLTHHHIPLTCTLEAGLRYTNLLRDTSKDTIRMNRELNPQLCNYLTTSSTHQPLWLS